MFYTIYTKKQKFLVIKICFRRTKYVCSLEPKECKLSNFFHTDIEKNLFEVNLLFLCVTHFRIKVLEGLNTLSKKLPVARVKIFNNKYLD